MMVYCNDPQQGTTDIYPVQLLLPQSNESVLTAALSQNSKNAHRTNKFGDLWNNGQALAFALRALVGKHLLS